MIHLVCRTLLVWALLLGALTLTGLVRPPALPGFSKLALSKENAR